MMPTSIFCNTGPTPPTQAYANKRKYNNGHRADHSCKVRQLAVVLSISRRPSIALA